MMTHTEATLDRYEHEQRRDTLPALAREALDLADGDTEQAASDLLAQIMGNPPAFAAAIDEALALGVRQAVERQVRTTRREIFYAPAAAPAPKVDFRAAVDGLKATHARMLLDFPLAGGLRLRDATRQEVVEQAERYRLTEKDAQRKRRWLEAIADLVPEDAVVGDVVTEAMAAELMTEN